MAVMNSVQDLLFQTVNELRIVEDRQLKTLSMHLPRVRKAELREALQQQEQETRIHRERLDQIFQQIGRPAQEVPHPVLDAMVRQGEKLLQAAGNAKVEEAVLIGEAQKLEHMELAGYGTAAALAKQMGNYHAADLLTQTLLEKKRIDERLSRIAETLSNPEAAADTQLHQQQQQQSQAAE